MHDPRSAEAQRSRVWLIWTLFLGTLLRKVDQGQVQGPITRRNPQVDRVRL